MKSGYHDHFCPKCGHGFICSKVTHCNDEFVTPCVDHRESLIEERAEELYRAIGKRPEQ